MGDDNEDKNDDGHTLNATTYRPPYLKIKIDLDYNAK
jgi:hypothetical protein